jgi:hypothetical protein
MVHIVFFQAKKKVFIFEKTLREYNMKADVPL